MEIVLVKNEGGRIGQGYSGVKRNGKIDMDQPYPPLPSNLLET
jgi:hypothetical protein